MAIPLPPSIQGEISQWMLYQLISKDIPRIPRAKTEGLKAKTEETESHSKRVFHAGASERTKVLSTMKIFRKEAVERLNERAES